MSMFSLPAKLALFVVVLAAAFIAVLYKVHTATQFFAIYDPRGDIGDYQNHHASTHHLNKKRGADAKHTSKRRLMKTEEEENRGPMNIILFYA